MHSWHCPPPYALTSQHSCCVPRLQLARLLAVSHGESELTSERWASARALDARRMERAGTSA